MSVRIAFDLDGVLVPDCEKIPNVGDLGEFLELTTHMLPLFQPKGKYWIITARPKKYKRFTDDWVKRHLEVTPKNVLQECVDETPEEYKARLLNKHPSIKIYIESDPKVVAYLRENVTTGCTVIHYSEYISNLMSTL